jgi:hypothetical protein
MFVILIVTLIACGLALAYWKRRTPLDLEAELLATDLIARLDDPDYGEAGYVGRHLCANQVKAINHARTKVGEMRDTTVNRLVASEVIRKFMSETLGMRPSHVARFAPVAIEMYFVPSESRVMAGRIRRTQAVRNRHIELGPEADR